MNGLEQTTDRMSFLFCSFALTLLIEPSVTFNLEAK